MPPTVWPCQVPGSDRKFDGRFQFGITVAQPAERVAALRFLQKMLHHPPKPLASGYFWQAIDRFHVPLP